MSSGLVEKVARAINESDDPVRAAIAVVLKDQIEWELKNLSILHDYESFPKVYARENGVSLDE